MIYLIKSHLHIFTAVFSLMILLSSCSTKDDTSVKTNLTKINLTEELSISADTDEALVSNFSSLTVDDGGNIYTPDTDQQKIHVFSPDGAYIDSIGRKGKGPGEFSDLDAGIKIAGDTLYALQKNSRRIDLLDIKSREPIRTIIIPDKKNDNTSIGGPRKIFPQSDGSIFVHFLEPIYNFPENFNLPNQNDDKKFTTFSLLTPTGDFINQNVAQLPTLYPSAQRLLYAQPRSLSVFITSFYPIIQSASDQNGNVYVGITDSLIFKKYDQLGSAIKTFKGVHQPPLFTDVHFDSLEKDKNNNFREGVEEVGAPERWPAFQNLLIDDTGRAWVSLVSPGSAKIIWWGFNTEGQPQWEFSVPAGLELYQIKEDKAYGISRSEDSFPAIKRYNINF